MIQIMKIKIYIQFIQYPEGKNLSFSEGKIKNINSTEIIHDASTKPGSSGSPILLKNTTEVIGIHKQGSIKFKENYGTLIKSLVQLLNQNDKTNINNYYVGETLNGLKHGKGIIYYPNGNVKYDGYFVNDKCEGFGKYIKENGFIYIGQWMNGLKHGKGMIYYPNGNIKYDGYFVNDKYEGFGKYIDITGNYYIGQLLNNLKHGKGNEYDKNGNLIYDGNLLMENQKVMENIFQKMVFIILDNGLMV